MYTASDNVMADYTHMFGKEDISCSLLLNTLVI